MLTDKEITEMYTSGVLPREIAVFDGRTIGTIYRILHKNSVQVFDDRCIKNSTLEHIKQLYLEGFSSRQVSKITNVSSSQVRKILKKEGITRTGFDIYNIKEGDVEQAIIEYKSGVGAEKAVANYNFSSNFLYRELIKRGETIRSHSEASCLSNTNKSKRGLNGTILIKEEVLKFESFYELIFIIGADKDKNVNNISRCVDTIPYYDNEKKRHYNPDFKIEYIDGSSCIIEIKPISRVTEDEVVLKQSVAEQKYDCYKIYTEENLTLFSEEIFNNYDIDVKESLSKYIKKYIKKIKCYTH